MTSVTSVQIQQAITDTVNAFPFENGLWTKEAEGIVIHKPDIMNIGEVAYHFFSEMYEPDHLPIPYWLACIDIESVFDLNAVNGNYLGSNPDKSVVGFDVGVCQLKIKYLMAELELDQASAYRFACDPSEALPYMSKHMLGLLRFSDGLIAGRNLAVPYNNRYLLATLAYNFGETGVLKYLDGPIAPHGVEVIERERKYAAKLNLPSVFTDIK